MKNAAPTFPFSTARPHFPVVGPTGHVESRVAKQMLVADHDVINSGGVSTNLADALYASPPSARIGAIHGIRASLTGSRPRLRARQCLEDDEFRISPKTVARRHLPEMP
jgi:hypothetical protein